MVRECRPPAREPMSSGSRALDNGDVDARQRELARQHQPCRTAPGNHHRMFGHRPTPIDTSTHFATSFSVGSGRGPRSCGLTGGLRQAPARYTLPMGSSEPSPFLFIPNTRRRCPPFATRSAAIDGALDHLSGIAQRTRLLPIRRRQRLDLRPLLIGESPFTRHGLATPAALRTWETRPRPRRFFN